MLTLVVMCIMKLPGTVKASPNRAHTVQLMHTAMHTTVTNRTLFIKIISVY